LEGKCFKYKNSYSLPKTKEDYWWLYIKVVKIEKSDLRESGNRILCSYNGWSFQTCTHETISINFNRNGYIDGIGKEITSKEFNTAWNQLLEKVKLLPEL